MPDRLPTLILLIGFWVPPAAFGWAAAEFAHRRTVQIRAVRMNAVLTTFVLGWAAVWFLFHLGHVPPYIPGATADPTYAPPKVVAGLAAVSAVLVLPGSALACVLALRLRRRRLRRASSTGASA